MVSLQYCSSDRSDTSFEESLFSYAPSSSATSAYSELSSSCNADLELRTFSFKLPLSLPRPENVQYMDYSRVEFDDDLALVPLPYILDRLQAEGPALLDCVTETLVSCPPNNLKLPPTVSVLVPASQSSASAPNYLLALTSSDNPRTLLLPVHGLVLATNCASLSSLARSFPVISSNEQTDASAASHELPVVHLNVPSSAAFALLTPYFYTASSQSLLTSLLPLHLTNTHGGLHSLLADTPNILASRLSVLEQDTLLRSITLVHQCWSTAVALGAGRDGLWKTMEMAWAVLVGALAIRESRRMKQES